MRVGTRWLLLAIPMVGLVGCSPAGVPSTGATDPAVSTESDVTPLIRLDDALRLSLLEPPHISLGGDQRAAVLLPPSNIRAARLQVPEVAPVLRFVYGLVPGTSVDCVEGYTLSVRVRPGGGAQGGHLVFSGQLDDQIVGWSNGEADLAGFEGQDIEIVFRTDGSSAPCPPPVAAIGDVHVVSGRASPPPDIWLVVVDALRADHVYGGSAVQPETPRLQALRSQSLEFADALSPAPWTRDSVFSMMTGTYLAVGTNEGRDSGVSFIPPRLPTVPERLREAGYRTRALYSNEVLLYPESGFERGFDSYHFVYEDEEIVTLLESHVADLEPRVPQLTYVHLMAPHMPYRYHPETTPACLAQAGLSGDHPARYEDVNGLREPPPSSAVRERVAAYYCGEVSWADRLVGDVLDAIDETGRTGWIFVLSDHGEELWDHGGFEHGHTLKQELLHVPLLVRPPGGHPVRAGGRVVSDPVSLVDLGPTLVQLTGAEPLQRTVGMDLSPLLAGADSLIAPARTRLAMGVLHGDPRFATLRDGRKAVLTRVSEPKRLPTVEIFDLVADPGEQHPLEESALAITARGLQWEWMVFQQLAYSGTLTLRVWLRPCPAGNASLTLALDGDIKVKEAGPVDADPQVTLAQHSGRLQLRSTAAEPIWVRLQLSGLREDHPWLRVAPDGVGAGCSSERIVWQGGSQVGEGGVDIPLPWAEFSALEWPVELPDDVDAMIGWEYPARTEWLVPPELEPPLDELRALGYLDP